MFTEIYGNLMKIFPKDIYDQKYCKGNELYLHVNPAKILDLSTYINTGMGYSLVSMFASDETGINGKYAIYYVFADRGNGLFLTLITMIDPSKMEFLSICEKVHAAALYEREIKDLFGMEPVGHPNAKRLVFHSNWPDREFPLRKSYDAKHKPDFAKENIRFNKITGEGVFET